jgi:ABC-type dipeptide/oligopeptide/nickel transport system permease subunit
LGTDAIGRDVLSRLIYGQGVHGHRPDAGGHHPPGGLGGGHARGYVGGAGDNLIMRITDVFLRLSDLLLYIIMMATLRDTPIGEWMSGLFLLFMRWPVWPG